MFHHSILGVRGYPLSGPDGEDGVEPRETRL